MFKLKYAKMYDNNIFTKYGLKPVAEDYFKVIDETFCIADGVTRDDIFGNAVGYPETKEEAIKWVQNYPNPSGAYEAAKIICEDFINEIANLQSYNVSKKVIEEKVINANKKLKKLNENRNINYLKEDYYSCVAVGGRIIENKLYCFSIGDCHITILDDEFNVIFTTINNHKQFEEFSNEILKKNKSFNWQLPECRVMVRKEYRNNPSKKYNGKDVSFGVLSGEQSAKYYIDTYCIDLKNTKYICAYSDGCEPFFASKDSIFNLIKNLDSFKETGKERTLIIYEKE